MVERRRYPRFELKVDARYVVLGSEADYEAGSTQNISAEGLCFESAERFKPGTYVKLEIDLKDNNPLISLVGEIRWSEARKAPNKERPYINGIKLVNIPVSDEGRFLKYYCDKMVEKLSDYLKK